MKNELVLCIEKEKCPTLDKVVTPYALEDINKNILKYENLWFIPRAVAETDERFLQIIPYVVVKQDGDILTYQRPSKNTDDRLSSKWSIGVGGHINLTDHSEDNLGSVIINAAARELKEEFNIWKVDSFEDRAALLFDSSDAVGRVHLGIVLYFDLPLDTTIEHDPKEISNYVFYTTDELKNAQNTLNLESWSKHIINS
jgi:predicted NUDIX family phosphoesterase